MNIKRLPKVGKILNIFLVLIIIYITCTIVFYIKSQMYLDGLLRMPDQPLLLYGFKWAFALLLLIGIIQLNSKVQIAYLLINSVSVSIILLWILIMINFMFYIRVVDSFLLEVIAIGLIITTNLGGFVKRYNIQRKLSDLLYVFAIPILVTVGIYYLVSFLINNNIICLY